MKLSFSRIILIVFFALLAISLLVGLLILNRSAKPLSEAEKVTALTNILGRPVVLKEKKVPTGNTVHQGKYVTFFYPAAAEIFIPKANGQPVKTTDLEDFFLSLGSSQRIDVTTSVILPSSSILHLEDYPGVRLRQSESDIYKQSTISADLQNGLLFEKDQDGFEKTSFFFVNGRIYIFSIQGSDVKTANSFYNEIISTMKFL